MHGLSEGTNVLAYTEDFLYQFMTGVDINASHDHFAHLHFRKALREASHQSSERTRQPETREVLRIFEWPQKMHGQIP